jgi:hypothetical protein
VVLAAGIGVGWWLSRPAPKPPAIETLGLDPATDRQIERTLRELQAAPRSGEAWGKLGSVLMHYEFIPETRQAFAEAERLAPREARWPYLHGLFLATKEPLAAMEKFRRAVELCGNQPDMPRLQRA